MTKYLITGGAGFIGSHLVDALLAKGDDVVVIDNFSNGSMDNLKDATSKHSPNKINIIEGDVCDPEACRLACKGVDFVFHEAALGSVARSVEHPIQTHINNANGTLNMLIAARDAGVKRFVYASSSSIYGNSKVLPRVESDKPEPISPYAVSKLAGENYVLAFYYTYGMETISLRYFNVFGPRQDTESQYAAVIPKFINLLINKRQPEIYGDGEQYRDFTYVSDVVNANMLSLSAPKDACGKAFNIACGRKYTLNELYKALQNLLSASISPKYGEPKPGDVKESLADITKAIEQIGYRPQVSFEEGLKKTVEYFKRDKV